MPSNRPATPVECLSDRGVRSASWNYAVKGLDKLDQWVGAAAIQSRSAAKPTAMIAVTTRAAVGASTAHGARSR